MIWGIDISDYQPDFDLHRTRREGFDFVIIKATEGTTWRGKWFRTHLDRARSAGLLTAAYHYVRSTDVPGQVRNIQAVVPKDCPLILDVEEGAGPLSVTWDLTNRLRAAGYKLPLLYLPKWWADKIGATDLRGLPPLWYSRYANNQGGYASQIWDRAGGWFDQFWGGYYGLHVEVMQFSSSATVAGRTPIDVNAYRGSREQLAALLGGGAQPVVSLPGGIESMAFGDKYKDWAGNDQTVQSWMNHVDERLWALSAFLFGPGSEPSRIPGDQNRTNGRDAIMDTVARASISKAMIEDLHRKVDELETGGIDVDLVADKVIEKLGPQIADAVANKLAERLAQ